MGMFKTNCALVIGFVTAMSLQTFGQDVPTKLDFSKPTTTPTTDPSLHSVRLSVLSRGECHLKFDVAAEPSATQPSTQQIALRQLPQADVLSMPNHQFRVTYEFAKLSENKDLRTGQSDILDGTLVVTPVLRKQTNTKDAWLSFPRAVAAPFSVTVWLDTNINLKFYCHAFPTALVVTFDPDRKLWVVTAEKAQKGLPLKTTHITNISSNSAKKAMFLVPPTEFNPDGSTYLMVLSPQEMRVKHLEISGVICAFWGIELDREKALVTQLEEGPAMTAGVKPGDVVVAIDGKPVRGAADVLNLLRRYHVGDTAVFTVQREGQNARVKLTAE